MTQEELDYEIAELLKDRGIKTVQGPKTSSFHHDDNYYFYNTLSIDRGGIGLFLLRFTELLEESPDSNFIVWRVKPHINEYVRLDKSIHHEIRSRHLITHTDRMIGIEKTIERYNNEQAANRQEVALAAEGF